MGMGYWGWLLAIFTIPPIIADKFDVQLVFYAEDGEVEYGGKKKVKIHIYLIQII